MRNERSWIQVWTGGKFFPLDPRPEDIKLEDIARALSMQCRYAGHVARFYSVAEHSVRVSRLVGERGGTLGEQLWGLLHDASEAYIVDIPRPLKVQPEFAGYREAEKVMQRAICQAFGLPEQEPEIVKALDWEILGTEAVVLKSPVHPDWAKTTSTGTLPAPLDLGSPLGWVPEMAEHCFLSRYRALRRRMAAATSEVG